MAVNENLDIGSLITGAIDRFYEQLDRERVWYEQKSAEATAFVESLYQRYLELRDSGLLAEAGPGAYYGDDDDFGDGEGASHGHSMADYGDDDENDAAAQFLKQHAQQPQAQQPKAKKPKATKGAQPQQARQAQTPDYRRGYKTGWKAAHAGHPAQPPRQEPEYVRGYMDGHKVSGHVQSIIGHYDNALKAHAEGNHDEADAHAAQAEPHAQEIAGHHFNDWLSKSRAAKGEGGVAAFRQHMDRVMKPTRNRWKYVQKTGQTVPLAGKRSALVGATYDIGKFINQNMEHPDEVKHPDHPATFGKQIGGQIANYAYLQDRPKKGKEAVIGHGGKGAEDQYQGPERTVQPVDPEAEAEHRKKVEAAKEEYARNAWGENEYKRHVDQHGAHPLAHHDSLESAKAAALSHWRDRLLRHINTARGKGMKYETPLKVSTTDENGQPITVDFDVGKALTDVVTHPAGAFSRTARADAIKNQLGDTRTEAGPGERPWGYTGQRSHSLHKLAGVMQRAERDWLHKQHPDFAQGGFMHNLSSGRKTKWDPKDGSPEDAIEESLDLFQTWLIDNADISDEQMASIMGSLEEQAYARLRAVNEA